MKIMTVGTSQICSQTIKAFKKNGVEIFACIGRDSDRTRKFAMDNEVDHFAVSYDDALLSSQIEAVYIALPNSLHYEYAKKALLNNKSVFLEKPFTTNLKEAQELAKLAMERNLYLFEMNMSAHNPAIWSIKRDLEQLGPLRMVEVNFSKYSRKYDDFKADLNPNIFSPEMSGGALMDLGVYNICLLVDLFGLPQASHYFYNEQKGIDTSGIAILRYDGFLCNSISGKDTASFSHLMINGENGFIYAQGAPNFFNSYRLKLNDAKTIEKSFVLDDMRAHEIGDMLEIIDNDDKRRFNDYLTLTLRQMKVMDELRNSSGLKFKAD